MTFLDDLLNRNPTRTWRAQPGLAIVLDLDDASFCGIRLGEPGSRLEKLGPAEDAAQARIGIYRYWSRGFACTVEQGRFVEVDLNPTGTDGRPCPTRVRRNGITTTLTAETTEADLVALLGPPVERSVDEAEEGVSSGAQLTWHLDRADCQAEFVGEHLDQLWLGTRT